MMKPGLYLVFFRHLKTELFSISFERGDDPLWITFPHDVSKVLLSEFKDVEPWCDRGQLIGYGGKLDLARLEELEIIGVVDIYE